MPLLAPTILDGSLPQLPAIVLGTATLAPSIVSGDAISLPVIVVTGAVQQPTVVSGDALTLPLVAIQTALSGPTVVGGDLIVLPASQLALAVFEPAIVSGTTSTIELPLFALSASVQAPTLVSGDAIPLPAAGISLALQQSVTLDASLVTLPAVAVSTSLQSPQISDASQVELTTIVIDVVILSPSLVTAAYAEAADALRIEYAGVEVTHLVAAGSPHGVQILQAAARNGPGTGRLLTNMTGDGLQWRAPDSATYGPEVDVSVAADYLLHDGDDNGKFLRVHVYSDYLVAEDWSDVELRENHNNAVASDDVSAAEAAAGDVETHMLTLRNAGANAISDVRAWIDAAVDYMEISDDNATWVAPTDRGTALVMANLAAGETDTLYLRRTIPAATSSAAEVLVLPHFSFDS
jgi:hypothetical protein